MRYLGVDFGKKRIGLALSDAEGDFAYPHSVVLNTKEAVSEVARICTKEGVSEIIFGESKDYSGNENAIMPAARAFANELSHATGLLVAWEPEFLTSAEATQLQGKGELLDASAAALILKSYLGRKKRG